MKSWIDLNNVLINLDNICSVRKSGNKVFLRTVTDSIFEFGSDAPEEADAIFEKIKKIIWIES